MYNLFINRPLLHISYHNVFEPIDKGLLELAGPTGLGFATTYLGNVVTRAQTGRVYTYA